MAVNGDQRREWEISGRIWRFAHFEFEESSRALRSHGNLVELESKPLEVLYHLLIHAGEVVTKEELLEAVWPGVSVVEGSLATAVSKLRKGLGEDDPPIVLTIPRVGYRLAVPAQCRLEEAPAAPELGFRIGDAVPGRDQWRFERMLGASPGCEVWLAEHPKTGEARVFKFAGDGVRLKGLKREVTLARLLRDTFGERPGFVRVLEWNFDAPPFYLESEYSGPNLAEWAESQGGLKAIPQATLLRVITELTQSVAAAHEAGVLHKDLKPANVLVAPRADGDFQVKVVDFGSGALLEPGRLRALGITNLGLTETIAPGAPELTGTLMYLPPEVLAGQSPTASADVYALGVMLWQMLASDFRRPLSAGWEAEIADPLLREDIALAACGDPARRLASVAALAERLQTLEQRRTQREESERERERARMLEQRVAAARARRPWVMAAAVALVLGLAASLFLYAKAVRESKRANQQTEIASAVNRFLADDLLANSDPFASGTSGETLIDAVKKASPDIDRQFQGAPDVAARLHHAIAKALDSRSAFPEARKEYDRAAALFVQADGALSQDAIAVRLQRAAMEARTYQKDALAQAKSIVQEEQKRLTGIPKPRADVAVWLAAAQGMIALIDNDVKASARYFQAAYSGSEKLPGIDENTRLNLKQKLAFTNIRLGDGATAERLVRELIAAFAQTSGPDSPRVLRVRLNLAQAYMIEGKNREAIDEVNAIYPQYLARLGADHELTMQLLTTRAQCEGTIALWDDAVRDDLAIYDLAIRKQGASSFYAIATLSDASLAQCRGGHFAQGEANARRSYEASVKAFGARAGLTGGAAYTLASCDIGLGNLAEASKLLQNIDGKVVAQLAGFPDWQANVTLAQGEIAYRERDYAAAWRYLEAAAPIFEKPDAERYQTLAVQTLRSRLKQTAPRK